jgi:hypothetical protein
MYGDGTVVDLPGGVDDYLRDLGGKASPGPPPPAKIQKVDGRADKKELARLERQLRKLEQREAGLHEQLTTHATDYEKVAALDAELRAVQAERSTAEEAWLELAERIPDA